MKNTKKIYHVLLILTSFALLSSCREIKITNTTVCSVAGVIQAGMDCAETLTDKTSELNFSEMIDFLEPKEEVLDKNGKVVVPGRSGAMCSSANDWNNYKTLLEQACDMLKKKCSYEMQQVIKTIDNKINQR